MKNDNIEEILNLIFKKVYGWEKRRFKNILTESNYKTWEEAQLFIRYKAIWSEEMPTVNEILELYELTDKKLEQWNIESIVFFLFVNQKKKIPKPW